jgi:NHL repeat
MHKIIVLALTLTTISLLIAGCPTPGGGGGDQTPLSSAKAITAFSFATPPATGVINENAKTVAVTLPHGTDVTALVATFATTGSSVKVGSTVQVSGTTANDFTSPVIYTVTAADGSTASYTMTITVASSSSKAITAFSFASPPVTGVINENAKTIAVTVPYGTDVTALVATFTTTGASVKVGSTEQVSGVTANNFTNPVIYTVTAADGSTASYTVTVSRAAQKGSISTVAGTGSQGYSGDGGAATSAQLSDPIGVAVDKAGNFYIAEATNHRIRKVDTNGIITTVAGNGSSGYSGDGGAATSAQINWPYDVAVDGAGNLFIADSSNQRIRKVNTNGMITTVAGNGYWGYSGDGGAAFSAQLCYPRGVALDSGGNLFIADSLNYCVRKVDTMGIITTVAGNGSLGYSGDGGAATSAQLNVPFRVAVDTAGNLFIGERNNHRIRKVDTNGIITTVAGNGSPGYSGDGGAATSAQLYHPKGVVVDTAGNLFIADRDNHRIRKVDASGIITTMAGNGTSGYSGDGGSATSAQLSYPGGIATDTAGNLFISDTGNNCVRKVLSQ